VLGFVTLSAVLGIFAFLELAEFQSSDSISVPHMSQFSHHLSNFMKKAMVGVPSPFHAQEHFECADSLSQQ
jgi:hypothetical protein